MDVINELEYCKKVQEVLKFLQSSTCQVHDDTLYQKLLDSLSEKIISPEFAKRCGVVDFLQRVGNNPDVSPDTLVFAVQLVERLVSNLEFSEAHVTVMSLLIETVAMNTSEDQLSVLCALFKTMSTVLHCQCVKEFCSNLNFSEVLKKSFEILKEERSIFLSRTVSDFISLLFTSEMSESQGVKNILKELQNIIMNLAVKDCHRVLSPAASCSLRVLEKAPHLFDDHFEEILDVLVKLLEKGNAQSAMTVTKCLSSLCHCQENTKSEKVKSLVSEVMQSGDIVKSLHIAKCLYPHQLLDKKALEDHILKPLCISDGSCHPVAAVSLSLTIVSECKIQNPNVCECVVNILKTTESRQEDYGGCNALAGNSRLQLKSLEYLRSYVCKEMVLPVTSSISRIIAAFTTDHMIYKKCLDCLCGLLPQVLCNLSSDTLSSDLCLIKDSVQRNFCRVEWEFRDTSCEFVTNLLNKHKGNNAVVNWMLDCQFHVFAYQAVSDSESYVRATSLGTLQAMLQSTHQPHLLQDTNTTIDEIISQVLEICETDSEAFSRRGAARLVHHRWRDISNHLQETSFQSIIHCFSVSLPSDFDWEVKLIAVDFWCDFLKRCFAGDLDTDYTTVVISTECSKIQKERKTGLIFVSTAVDVLLKLSGDYDPSVNERVHQELCWISEVLQPTITGRNEHFLCSCSSCVQQIKELFDKITENRDNGEMKGLKFKTDYGSNAMSLLDDILSLDRSQEDDDNVIDCY